MGNIAFRDFTIYIIPGAFLGSGIILILYAVGVSPTEALPQADGITSFLNVLIVTIGAMAVFYTLGQFNMMYSGKIWKPLAEKRGDPRVLLLDKMKSRNLDIPIKFTIKQPFSPEFIDCLLVKLREVFGEEVVESERNSGNLFLLCQRFVGLNCQEGHSYVDRTLMVYNYALAMIIPSFVFGVSLLLFTTMHYRAFSEPFIALLVISLFVIVTMPIMFKRRFEGYFLEHAFNTYALFYAYACSQQRLEQVSA
ncbi:hypothetical protein ACFLWX_03370 [Chloroflexota bacterium]